VVDIQPTPTSCKSAWPDRRRRRAPPQPRGSGPRSQPSAPVAVAAALAGCVRPRASKPRDGRRGNGQSEFSSSPQLMTEESPPSPRRLARRIQPAQLLRQATGAGDQSADVLGMVTGPPQHRPRIPGTPARPAAATRSPEPPPHRRPGHTARRPLRDEVNRRSDAFHGPPIQARHETDDRHSSITNWLNFGAPGAPLIFFLMIASNERNLPSRSRRAIDFRCSRRWARG